MVVGTDARQFGGWLGVGLGREGNSLSLSIEVQVSHLVSVVLSVCSAATIHSPSVVPPIKHVCLPFMGSSELLMGPPCPFIYRVQLPSCVPLHTWEEHLEVTINVTSKFMSGCLPERKHLE